MHLAYFSPVPWASFHQRPHEFVHWFRARFGGPVLWVEPYPVRLPRWGDLQRPRVTSHADVPDWLEVVAPRALPAEPLAIGRALNRALAWPSILRRVQRFAPTLIGIGKPSDLALRALEQMPGVTSVYDAMDDFSAFHHGAARTTALSIEGAILRRAALRCTSSSHIAARLRDAGLAVELVPNGVASDRLPPWSGADPQGPFGYVGTIAAWFDWDWVCALAAEFPERRIEIHGPLFQPPPRALPANVTLGPAMPHADALRRMQGFAAGLIPFLRNELTASVDPVKYYEYRALGLPVVATPFGEMLARSDDPRVVLADVPVRSAIEPMLAARDTAESVADFRRQHDWLTRFDALAAPLQAPKP